MGLGAPASVRHAGSVLTAVVGEQAASAALEARPEETTGGGQGESTALNEREAEEVEEHLRGLGYLE